MEQGLNKNKIKTVCFPHTQREDRESERKSPDSPTSLFRLPLSLGQYSIVSARAKIRWPQCSARPEQTIVLSESETPGENKTGTNTQCKRGVVQRSCAVSIHGHAGLYLQQLCVCVRVCMRECTCECSCGFLSLLSTGASLPSFLILTLHCIMNLTSFTSSHFPILCPAVSVSAPTSSLAACSPSISCPYSTFLPNQLNRKIPI